MAEVQSILSELKQGLFKPRSEMVSEKEQPKAIIQTLKYKIGKAEEEIFSIKDSEDYQITSDIHDWNEYFEQKKVELIKEVNNLEADPMVQL